MIKETIVIEVCEEDLGKRVDQFLSEEIEGYTRSFIQKLIEETMVKIEGINKVKSGYKLKGNEIITVNVPENEELKVDAEDIPIEIVYEDEYLVIINKEPGMCVHPANGHLNGTLVNAVLYHIKGLSGINGIARPGIVHRLDMDTSGLIIVAKTDEAHHKLVGMFQDKSIKKTYVALLKGKMNKKSGRVETLIGRHPVERKKMSVVEKNGKIAITNYEVMEDTNINTLVKVGIETGRTHQIRVHMKYLGYPIDGDEVYGRGGIAKRQMLHAYQLEFRHPVTGKEMEIIGKVPEDFVETMKKMGISGEKLLKCGKI